MYKRQHYWSRCVKLWASTADGQEKLRAGKANEMVQKLLADTSNRVALVQDVHDALRDAAYNASPEQSAACAGDFFDMVWLCDACDIDEDAPAAAIPLTLSRLDEATKDLLR